MCQAMCQVPGKQERAKKSRLRPLTAYCLIGEPDVNQVITKTNAKVYLEVYFPGGSDTRESACIARDLSWIPRLGRSPGEGNGKPLQYSLLENVMNSGAW